VLTRDILFGMNILTLAGFVVMGLTLTLNRMGQAGKAFSIGLNRGNCSGLPRVVGIEPTLPGPIGGSSANEISTRGVKLLGFLASGLRARAGERGPGRVAGLLPLARQGVALCSRLLATAVFCQPTLIVKRQGCASGPQDSGSPSG
jgi:hypothetical protein